MAWARTSRQSRGYGAEWSRLRLVVLKRDGYLCQCSECKDAGRITPASQVDHILPKAQGGTDALRNLQAINAECHKRKTKLENGAIPTPATGIDGWSVSA